MLPPLSQVFPPPSRFDIDSIPDVSGKVMIVTGGNRGIGKETVKALLKRGATVYMASRNRDAAFAAIKELKDDTGKVARFLHLDLISMHSIRRAAHEFLSKESRLDVLINGAAVMYLTETPGHLDLTDDGFDIQWGVNVIGPYYFTTLLLPALLAGAAISYDQKSRVIFTAGHLLLDKIMFDTLTSTLQREWISPIQRYAQSKFANIVLAQEFSRRYGEKGLVAMSVNPGVCKTDLQRNLPWPCRSLLNPLLRPASAGALTQLWGATSPEGAAFSGEHLIPLARRGGDIPGSKNPELAIRLLTWLEENILVPPSR